MKPIRVLQIVTKMDRGGMESRLMDLYRNIDRGKVQFDFYTFREDEGYFDKEILKLGGKIYYHSALKITNMRWKFKELGKELEQHGEYQIVHCHMNAWCGTLLRGAKNAGVRTRIAHSRTALDGYSIKNIAKNIIKWSTNKNATHLFAVSKEAGRWLFGGNAMRKGEVKIFANAIESEKYLYNEHVRTITREELKINEEFVIIHVGSFIEAKNHKLILEIFSETLKKEPNSKLLLVGGGIERYKYEDMAERIGIANKVVFMGVRSDINVLLQAADIFIFPSLYEGLPGAVLEAQAAGLPCLVADTVTRECKITPLVEFLSLKSGVEIWSKKIIRMKTVKRENTYDYFKQSGFDIQNLANEMQRFYINEELETHKINP